MNWILPGSSHCPFPSAVNDLPSILLNFVFSVQLMIALCWVYTSQQEALAALKSFAISKEDCWFVYTCSKMYPKYFKAVLKKHVVAVKHE